MPLNNLEVNVSANTKDLSKGLRQAEREQTRFGRNSERMSQRLERRGTGTLFGRAFSGQTLAKGLGAAGAAVGAARAMQVAVVRELDSVAKTARKSGLLQRSFRTAGEQAFDEWAMGFERDQAIGQRVGRTLLNQLFGQRVSSLGGALMRFGQGDLAGARNEALGAILGEPEAAPRRTRRELARESIRQRVRVTGAAERGTQAEASALAGMIARQTQGDFQRRMLAQLAALLNEVRTARGELQTGDFD